MDTINNRIETLIKELGISKTAFGEKLNVTQQYISKLVKSGTPSIRLIEDICQKFDVNKNWLLTGKGRMRKERSIEEEGYSRFGKIMEGKDPIKKNMVTMLLAMFQTLPDEQWEYIYAEFKMCIGRIEKEKEEGN